MNQMMEDPTGPLTDQLRRERLRDMEVRLGRVRRQAFAVLAVGLLASGPWIGFWFLIPLAVALGAFAVADRRVRDSQRPGTWAAAGWGMAPLMIAVSAALTGAADSPALMWFALPVATLGARFESRGVRLGVAYVIALILLVALGLDAGTVLERPDGLIFVLALVIGMAILSGATVESDREHRRGAVLDPLTGLLNRSALAQRFAELEQQAGQGADSSLGFLVGDIDHFKRVNDRHGHPFGDAVLKEVGYAMRKTLRAFDLIYRVGGEEFAVLLPGADLEKTREIGERLREAVAATAVGEVSVTMSFGAAAVAGTAVRFADVYADADAALYRAKRDGRDRVAVTGARPAAAFPAPA